LQSFEYVGGGGRLSRGAKVEITHVGRHKNCPRAPMPGAARKLPFVSRKFYGLNVKKGLAIC
jgi:hypothetical protein